MVVSSCGTLNPSALPRQGWKRGGGAKKTLLPLAALLEDRERTHILSFSPCLCLPLSSSVPRSLPHAAGTTRSRLAGIEEGASQIRVLGCSPAPSVQHGTLAGSRATRTPNVDGNQEGDLQKWGQ